MNEQDQEQRTTPCGTSCWHEIYVACTLPTGHSGDHAAHGPRFPGAPVAGRLICTWKRSR